jgi:hypothetical protein
MEIAFLNAFHWQLQLKKCYLRPNALEVAYMDSAFHRMVSSWMLRRVALVRTDVSEEQRLLHQSNKNRQLPFSLGISSQRASVAGYS